MARFCSSSIAAIGDRSVSVSWRNSVSFAMTSAASGFGLRRWLWILPDSLTGYDGNTNYRFQFCAIRKKKWCGPGGCSMLEKKVGLLCLLLFWWDAIGASD